MVKINGTEYGSFELAACEDVDYIIATYIQDGENMGLIRIQPVATPKLNYSRVLATDDYGIEIALLYNGIEKLVKAYLIEDWHERNFTQYNTSFAILMTKLIEEYESHEYMLDCLHGNEIIELMRKAGPNEYASIEADDYIGDLLAKRLDEAWRWLDV